MKKIGVLVLVFAFNSVSGVWAAFGTNEAASIVIGQPNMTVGSANQGNSTPGANSLNSPMSVCSDNQHLIIADYGNSRVLIFNHIPNGNNMTADVVVGQPNMTSNTHKQGGIGANTLNCPRGVYIEGHRLFVADSQNNRVLIFNQIPTTNNANADIVIGQANSITGTENQGNGYTNPGANTLFGPSSVYCDGQRLFISDHFNNRILIYNQIPDHNNAAADIVIGQPDMFSCNQNQNNSNPGANTLNLPYGIIGDGQRLYATDSYNNRILIYDNIPNTHNAAADHVIGQADMVHNGPNQSGNSGANTLSDPYAAYSNGQSVYTAEWSNNRALIFNGIPNSNNVSADIVMGQPSMTANCGNQGNYMTPGANTLKGVTSIFCDNLLLYIVDSANNRVLIYYPIPANSTPTSTPGPGHPTVTPTPAPDFQGQVIDPQYFYVYPNPTHGVNVKFRFFLPQSADVKIKIYTPTNDFVWETSGSYPSGWSELTWNASGMANGVYLYLGEASNDKGRDRIVKKLVLLK
jgi:hypothetical protein